MTLRLVTDQDAARHLAGLQRLAAAVWPDPPAVLGITDADDEDPDNVVELALAHRLNRHPETP